MSRVDIGFRFRYRGQALVGLDELRRPPNAKHYRLVVTLVVINIHRAQAFVKNGEPGIMAAFRLSFR